MRTYLIIDILGLIAICIGILLLIPIIPALIYQEWPAVIAFSAAGTIGITIGTIARMLTPKFTDIQRSEGIVVVAIAWLIATTLGVIPYLFFNLSFVDAFFESMSGFTTTGATILKDFSLYPKSLFFWRSFTQWLGGLGILVFFIAILPQFAVAGRQLFFAETSGPTEEKLTPRIRHTAINLWQLYIAFTIIEITLLTIFGMPFFDAICNSFSTLSAGGFSPNPQSIMGYNSTIIKWIIIIFMFIAGTNFALQFKVISLKKPKLLVQNSEFLFYSIVFIIASIVITLILLINQNGEFYRSFTDSTFQSIAILTGTGFAIADYNCWPDGSKAVLIALMFIGGCAGSSAGSIKVVRILLLTKVAIREIVQVIHPKAVLPLKLDRQVVSLEVVRQIAVFFIFYMLLLILSAVVISIIENDLVVGFISSVVTIGTIGPGLGAVGPMSNYADLSTITKIILTFNMWIGRLEIMTVLVLLYPYLWKNLSKE